MVEHNSISNRTGSDGILEGENGGALDDITFDDEPFDDGEPPNDRKPPDGGGPPDDGEPPDDDDSEPLYTDPSSIQDPVARRAAERMFNSIKDHLTPDDLRGALRDMYGDPVLNPNTGRYYSHLGEVNDAMRSIRNAINALKGRLDDPKLSSSDRNIIEVFLSRGSKTLDYVEKVLSRDKWFPGTRIPFP